MYESEKGREKKREGERERGCTIGGGRSRRRRRGENKIRNTSKVK